MIPTYEQSSYDFWVREQLEPTMSVLNTGTAKRYAPIKPRYTPTAQDKENEAYIHRTDAERRDREDAYLMSHGITWGGEGAESAEEME